MAERLRERGFGYGGFRACVRAADTATLDWLAEACGPWFSAGGVREGPFLDFRVDPEELRRIVAGAEPTGRRVECFTMDQAGAGWELLRGPDGAELAWEPELRVVVRASPGAVEIVAAAERPYGRLVLLRALRELAGAGAARAGDLAIHASAVAVGGRVTLFVGGKGSGKSTLLLQALRDAGVRFVANDRVYMRGAVARGMPTVISLRDGSLDQVPGLREELASGAWHHASTLAEARAHRAAGTTATGARRRWPPGLSAAQLCALLGSAPSAGGEVERILFVSIAQGERAPGRFDIRPMQPEESVARMIECGLLAGGRSAQFLSTVPPRDRAALEATIREVVTPVACYRCVLGPDAYSPPSVWHSLPPPPYGTR